MHRRGPYKRILLFLIAVVLPSSVLIVLTWCMIGQQKELREKRLADERRRLAREISQELLARLEEIKLREVSASDGGVESLNTLDYTSNEVVLTALANGEQILLPWQVSRSTGGPAQPLSEPAFARKIRRAEEEEFTQRRLAQAGEMYLDCVERAESPAQQAYARLLRARVLAKLGQADESLTEYNKVLAVSRDITDENGIPLCLYAASRLLEQGHSHNEVTQLIASELGARQWLSPAESYMLRDLLDALIRSGAAPGIGRQRAEAYQEQVIEYISRLEQALALQADFPPALNARLKNPKQATEPVWVPFGQEPWLVGLAAQLSRRPLLVIVVRISDAFDSIIAKASSSEKLLENIRLTTSADLTGEPLGRSFPGLRLTFPPDSLGSLSPYWSLQRSFYLIAVSLVLCVTLFGAYFLWSDVGRELRMAEMRSQFIASVSHELKTPLTAIRIFAETLRMDRLSDAQAKTEYLDTIVNESHRLTRLLNNVLDFSKIEKGKRTYHKEPACLSDIVHAAVQATQYPLKQQDFHLDVCMEDNLPDICVDHDAIEQAILNLLSNAMKYSGQSRRIELRVQKKAGYIVIEVSDRGVGIDPAQQKHIFEKFYRVPSKENARIPGTGLGLTLVSHIVEAHNGHIEVRSVLGEGCTFSIHLPVENKR